MYLDLNPDLTPTQLSLKEEFHRFAANVIRPASVQLDKLADPEDVIRKGSALWDVFRKFHELEYHLALVSGNLGDVSLGGVEHHIIREEMGWGAADIAIGLDVSRSPFSLGLIIAMLGGNQRVMDDIVTPYMEDREGKYIGCWAITEPQHGSDCLAFGTEQFSDPSVGFDTAARRDGDDWIINGGKAAWVSNGTIATHAMVHFAIDRSRGMMASGIAIVPLDLPGVSRGKPLNKLGQRALNQGEIYFDDVRIPKEYVVVEPEAYGLLGELVLTGANSVMAPVFTGVARAAFEEAMTYCRQRVQGGKPLCEHQLVQRKLFDIFTKVESARQLSRAVTAYNSAAAPPQCRYAIMAKVYCTQVAFEVASDAVQLFGGYGLSKDFLVEKLFRDARAAMIEDGANDTLALVASRQMLGASI